MTTKISQDHPQNINNINADQFFQHLNSGEHGSLDFFFLYLQ